MGFFSSVCSVVSSAVSGVCRAVSSLGRAIGGAINNLATNIIKPLINLSIERIEKVIEVVGIIIHDIGVALGLIEEEDSAEEIGMKAEEAEKQGIKPEDFDNYEAYISHLNANIEIDKTKLQNLSTEDRIKYTTVGISILSKGIEEKEKIEIPGEFLAEIGKCNLNTAETREYIKVFKEKDLELKDFPSYLNGTLDNKKYTRVGNAIESAIINLNPEISQKNLDEKIDAMRYESRK